ncbi:MAG: DUF4142 domain-containing protein [Gemmatimonadales bacterium]|nr:DUF4142 domain-containing protein [Gemmatimonadales bacterium]
MSMRTLMAGAAGGLAVVLGSWNPGTLNAQVTSLVKSVDQQFIGRLAAGNLLEVRLGQAARTKASNSSVKQFAERMVLDHTSMQKEWMALAARSGLVFKATLSPPQVEQWDRLNKLSGAEFDRAYMSSMVQNHRENVSSFQTERGRPHSPGFKELIDRDLVALQAHVDLAQQVSTQMGAGTTATTGAQPDTASSDTTSRMVPQSGQTAQNVRADSAFISEVDAGNVTELRLARMAESKAAAPTVKSFAQKMAADHSRMRSEWAAISSKYGLRFTPSVNPRHQEQLTRLERISGTAFDRVYMAAMVQNHQENVNSFRTRGRAVQSYDALQVVNRSLPSLEQHLTLAQQVASQVGAPTGVVTSTPPRADSTIIGGPEPDLTDYDREDRDDKDRGNRRNVRADAQFIRDVDATHFLHVRLGRLAKDRARDPAVKRFGERMEKDHGDLQKQWSNVASRHGMKFKSGMGPDHRAHLERLEKTSRQAFDREYMTLMIQSHNGSLNYWRKEGRAAKSVPVRQLVQRGIPTWEDHLILSKQVGSGVGVDAKAALAGLRIAAERER